MRTVFGRLADPLGHAHAGGRAWATPASSYRREQDARVMIDRDHDGRPVGEIVFLARQREGLWAVGEVSDEVTETVAVRVGGERVEVPSPLYWSASRIGDPDYGYVLGSVALTASPASVCARPVQLLEGRLDHRQAANRWRSRVGRDELELLERAAIAHCERRRGEPVLIHDEDELGVTRLRGLGGVGGSVWIDAEGEPLPFDERQPPGALRIRPCGGLLSVR